MQKFASIGIDGCLPLQRLSIDFNQWRDITFLGKVRKSLHRSIPTWPSLLFESNCNAHKIILRTARKKGTKETSLLNIKHRSKT